MTQEKLSPKPSGGRRGRPARPEHERRRHRVSVALNDEEFAILTRNRGELDASDYLRSIALRGRRPTLPVPQIRREEFVRLYYLQRRLETLELYLNGEGVQNEAACEMLDVLGRILGELLTVRRTLLLGV